MQDVRNQRTLTDTDVHGVLLNALHCAARTYKELALQVRTAEIETVAVGMVAQFERQAKDATDLAERIESALSVVLIGEGE